MEDFMEEQKIELKIINMADIQSQKIEWLWYPFIPYGKLTIIQGDPGDGKTTLVLNLAAKLSKGIGLDEDMQVSEPMNIIYQTAEDGLADTVKPRLEAADADCEKIMVIDESEKSLSMIDERLEQAIVQTNARLLILDPIQAYLGGGMDMNRANEARDMTKKLGLLAEKHKCAIILIGHMNKAAGNKAAYRGMGSIDFFAVARSVLLVGRIEGQENTRAVVQIKNNLAAFGHSKAFELTEEGFHWLEEILKLDAKAVVIFITAYADTEKAVQAIKQGATDFIPKPWQNEKLIATVSSALQLSFSRTEVETLKQQKETLKKQTEALTLPPEPTRVIGESAAMQTIFQTIRKFSETDANLLLLGENGTGKDLIARYVYEQSPRKNEIYVPIDLGSIPDTLFESELFGYEKGAFTDARKNKPGRVEVASGGTLFLNEIGNLSLPLQAKLLSVIEQRKSSRLGSTTSYPVDVRLICATNTDLYTAIDNGQFRQDLLYRINTIEIRIPPLRERGNDLFLLADFFLQRYRKKYKKELRGISREARKMLQLYRWPGNVRELEHAIERAVILSTGTMLTPDDFMLRSPRSSNTVSEKDKYNLERMEKDAINEVMRMCGGNITLAAEMLGITRTSLYRRIEKFRL